MSSDMNNSSYPSYFTPSLARRIQRTNQELRNRTAANQDSSYGQLPPRDYSTLPNRRPLSRTGSLRSEDGSRRPGQLPVPSRSPSYAETSRSADKNRGLDGNVSWAATGDGGHTRGYVNGSDNGRDYTSSGLLSKSFSGSKDGFGSSDSVNLAGKKDYGGRDRNNYGASESDGRSTRNYLPPTRRNIATLDGGHANSLPRRNPYRSCMSDTADYAPKKVEDYQRSRGPPTERTNNYEHETLPPLPQPSVYARKRDGGVQRSSSYLRQRALDIANIYGAPLPSQEPARLERGPDDRPYEGYRSGTVTPTNQPYVTPNNGNFEERMANRFGRDPDVSQRGRSQIPTGSHYRSNSLSRGEIDQSPNESVREAIIRRQKSFDRLNEEERSQKPKLRRPLSLSLQLSSDKSVLNKFYGGELIAESNGPNNLSPNDNKPPSPVRSPGRKVSRFLRPDFYDTPREDSTFAKEKEEAAKNEKEAKNERIEQILRNVEENCARKAELKQSETAFSSHNGVALQKPEVNTRISAGRVGNSDTCLPTVRNKDAEKIVVNGRKSPEPLQTNQTHSTNADTATLSKNIIGLKSDQMPLAKNPLDLASVNTANNSKTNNVMNCTQTQSAKQIATTNAVVASEITKTAEVGPKVTKIFKPKVVKKESVPTEKCADNLTKPKEPVVSKESKDVSTKLPLKTVSDFVKVKVLKKDEVSSGNSSMQQNLQGEVSKGPPVIIDNLSTQEGEPKDVTKVTEGTKVKVKRKVKKVVDKSKTSSEIPSSDSLNDKDNLKAKVEKIPPSEVDGKVDRPSSDLDPVSNPVVTENGNKPVDTSEAKGDKDAKSSTGKSRIDTVIRSLREQSSTPKEGGDAHLSMSNLLKRAVSVDDCSSSPVVTKSTNKIKKVIKSLKELTSSPKTNMDTESNLLKRAVSVDDCSNPSQTKSNKVNSVLGMFRRMEEPKADAKPDKKASLLSRFRKTQSLYAGSTSDSVLVPGSNKDIEKNDKIVNSSFKKFGFRSFKNDKNVAGFEPNSGNSDAVNGTDLKGCSVRSSPARLSNHVSRDSKLPVSDNAEQNVSCSVRVRLPEKDISKYAKLNGTSNGEDVSVNTTLKVVKDVTNEKLVKTNPSIRETEMSAAKDVSNVSRINGENGVGPEISNQNVHPKRFSRIPQMSATKKSPSRDDNSDFKDARTGDPTSLPDPSSLSENSSKLKNSDPCSSSSLLSDDEAESFDSCSVCSDWEFRTSPLPAHRRPSADLDGTESMQDRIRRKSFYSRFNDTKKRPSTRRASASLVPSPRDLAYGNHTAVGKPF